MELRLAHGSKTIKNFIYKMIIIVIIIKISIVLAYKLQYFMGLWRGMDRYGCGGDVGLECGDDGG